MQNSFSGVKITPEKDFRFETNSLFVHHIKQITVFEPKFLFSVYHEPVIFLSIRSHAFMVQGMKVFVYMWLCQGAFYFSVLMKYSYREYREDDIAKL